MKEVKCKICRRLGKKLFLKGERCFSQKCAMIKKPYAPGMFGASPRRRRGLSEYGLQLAAKQRLKAGYGLGEKQLKRYFREVFKKRGSIDELFLQKLERRLDNVIFRLGLASSRREARQLISHGWVKVNKRKIDIPSFEIKKGDFIEIKSGLKEGKDLERIAKNRQLPSWLENDPKKLTGRIKSLPEREELEGINEVGLIIEYYNR